eukprot:4051166-Prymnesium_polylepis.1
MPHMQSCGHRRSSEPVAPMRHTGAPLKVDPSASAAAAAAAQPTTAAAVVAYEVAKKRRDRRRAKRPGSGIGAARSRELYVGPRGQGATKHQGAAAKY